MKSFVSLSFLVSIGIIDRLNWLLVVPVTLWVWISPRWGVLNTTLCDKVCQWLTIGRLFSLGTLVSSTNKTYPHDRTEILLKVSLSTKTLTLIARCIMMIYSHDTIHIMIFSLQFNLYNNISMIKDFFILMVQISSLYILWQILIAL